MILDNTFRSHVLRPKVSLNTKDMAAGRITKAVRCRIQGIDTVDRNKTSAAAWLEQHIFYLLIVKIAMGCRRHHDIMTSLSSLSSRCRTTPRHNHSILWRMVFEQFIPSEGMTAMCRQELKYTLREIALKCISLAGPRPDTSGTVPISPWESRRHRYESP